ncbi:hypothetical protein BLL52_0506 [Rhodoferax antarcticus ANT.BR]|uniref:Uncharacterized protein n=1 Tax=Rhodoferax antarcticus ANT.BR TaxID=1111071 RepID=A0A1Q8YJI8_9BURK|nr:hypothetical protein BLL52_0506 [Rhodoferax antarcticus ANT.BR]
MPELGRQLPDSDLLLALRARYVFGFAFGRRLWHAALGAKRGV